MFIYKITNLINGKIYIGQTTRSVKERWKGHRFHKGCIALNRAINKYGKDNFIIEEIYCSLEKEDLNKKEQYFIKYFNCLVPEGYNISVGGNAPMLSRKHSKKAKDNISKKLKGISKTFNHCNNISKAKLQNNFMKNRFGELHHLAKKIVCSNGNIYNSLHEAARKLNLPVQNISKVLKNKRNTCGGYKFKYLEENHG